MHDNIIDGMSAITLEDLKLFCRIDDSGEEDGILTAMLNAGKQFVLSQTGLTAEEADQYADLKIAVLMFCADLYNNRQYSTDRNAREPRVNPAVKAIIDQYCMNIL